MNDLRREILSQVAAGTLTAEEGAARLDSLEAAPAAPETTTAPRAPALPAAAASRQVKVVSQFGSAEIVGDASVAYVVADGPHHARQEGDTMIIEHAPFDDNNSFSFGKGEHRRVVINGFDIQRRRLTVRMNPELALVASVQAGNVRVEGVHGPITCDVQAGNCRVEGFRGPLSLTVMAGNLSASGRLDGGASKVRCEAGSVKVNLERGSSVRITARTTIGKVAIEGEGGERATVGPSGRDVTIGSGAGTLDVECTMGNVKVQAD
jgi:hypothetical protein